MLTTTMTQFADSSSGLGSLGIDGKAFIIQLVTFALAFWVLKRFAFEPISKMLEQRRKTIEDGVSLGEQMKKDKAALEAKVSQALADARAEADGIVAEAHDAGRQAIREAEEKASAKAAVIVKEGEERAAGEMARARKQLEGEIVSLVSDVTETIIGEKVDAAKDAELITRALKEQQA